MSKTSPDALFELIQSLTKSEKRYFKLRSTQHTIGDQNNYILLFDYLDAQKSYDEEKLRAEFKGEAFLNRLSISKKRLYDHILNALDQYYAGSSIESQIHKMLHSFDILYRKSLYSQCEKILRSAEKLALKHDLFNMLSEISRKQKKLIENQGYSAHAPEDMDRIFEKDLYYAEQSNLFNKLWAIKGKLFSTLNRKGSMRRKEDLDDYLRLSHELVESVGSRKLYFEANYLYFHIRSAGFFAMGNFAECAVYLQKNLELFEAKTSAIDEFPSSYFGLLANAIYVYEKLGDRLKVQEIYQKLRLQKKNLLEAGEEDTRIKLFSSISSLELNLLLKRGELDRAVEESREVEQNLQLFSDKLSFARMAFLNYKIGIIHFSAGNHREALRYMNNILNHPGLDEKEDIVSFALLMELLINFELGNYDYLRYTYRNTRRTLSRRNRLYRFESVFLNMISKLLHARDEFEREVHWSRAGVELEEIRGNEYEQNALEYFDLPSWIRHKLTARPFQLILQENYNA